MEHAELFSISKLLLNEAKDVTTKPEGEFPDSVIKDDKSVEDVIPDTENTKAEIIEALDEMTEDELEGILDVIYLMFLAEEDLDNESDEDESIEEAVGTVYTVNITRKGNTKETEGTLAELIAYFGHTLETGASYQSERGNKKINCSPKNIGSLIINLNNAKSNSAANGSSDTYYTLSESMIQHQTGQERSENKQMRRTPKWKRKAKIRYIKSKKCPAGTTWSSKSKSCTKIDLDMSRLQKIIAKMKIKNH